jgi:hypothetical protein
MNKFIAILKDSYREAMNTWVIPVMMILSVLVMLFIASISFKPITLEDELNNTFSWLNYAFQLNPNNGKPTFAVEKMQVQNEQEPWKSNYQFEISFTGATPEFMKQVRSDGQLPFTRRRTEIFIGKALPFLDNVKAEDISPKPVKKPAPEKTDKTDAKDGKVNVAPDEPTELRFLVTTKGTKINDRMSWIHTPRLFFVWDVTLLNMSLRDGVYTLEKRLINDFGAWIILLVSIVITAGFIPNMINKGVIDLYISKPISRSQLLIYKYLGGLIFITVITSFTIGGVWLVIGLRTGIWSPNFLAVIPLLTFYFAILYAVSTLVGTVTRSTLVAILATILAWAFFFVVGWGTNFIDRQKAELAKIEKQLNQQAEQQKDDEDAPKPERRSRPSVVPLWLDYTAHAFYYPLPRTYDLDDRMIEVIARGTLTEFEFKQNGLEKERPSWWQTLGASFGFITVCLILSCWWLARRDG